MNELSIILRNLSETIHAYLQDVNVRLLPIRMEFKCIRPDNHRHIQESLAYLKEGAATIIKVSTILTVHAVTDKEFEVDIDIAAKRLHGNQWEMAAYPLKWLSWTNTDDANIEALRLIMVLIQQNSHTV